MYNLLLWSCVLLGYFGGTIGLVAAQSNPMRAPKDPRRVTQQTPETSMLSPPAAALDAYVRFFQQVISPLDGPRSTMAPTGSVYARKAIKKHGALLGTVMTVERLMHEGNESQIAPRIRRHGLWRTHDPVEANDWWWYGPPWVYRSQPALSQEP
jgi:putative component of membrane protein insertase Oxa1/YidC/SpoIIIJ protein YidD